MARLPCRGRRCPCPNWSPKLRDTPKAGLPQVIAARVWTRLGPSQRYAYLKTGDGGFARRRLCPVGAAGGSDFAIDLAEGRDFAWPEPGPYTEIVRMALSVPPPKKPISSLRARARSAVKMLRTALEFGRNCRQLRPCRFYVRGINWDGIRVQAVSDQGARRLYSRTGDDISGRVPRPVGAALDF